MTTHVALPTVLVVGLNHRTAPFKVRERLALDGEGLRDVLAGLYQAGRSQGIWDELVILSTCNRLEVYVATTHPAEAERFLITRLASLREGPPLELNTFLYIHRDRPAVAHLLRVAAGLDSQILGETQILGQVGMAWETAREAATCGPILSRLFQQAVHTGKRARTETEIGRHPTSVAHVAVRQAASVLGDLRARTALLIGAGEMARLAALTLHKHGLGRLLCLNRTKARAETLTREIGGQALDWTQLGEALVMADLVVSATAAPHLVVTFADVEGAMRRREGRPLVLLDIAIPRDIDPAVDALPSVIRYDMNDLHSRIDAHFARRAAAVPAVERIIAVEADAFMAWFHGLTVVPVVVGLRRRAEAIAHQEAERTCQRLRRQSPDPDRIDREVVWLADRIVAKLLHEPILRLKARAAQGDGLILAQTVSELFALEISPPSP